MIVGEITCENPDEHWKPITVNGGIVLDLGCGFNDEDSRNKRWSSPYYFKKENAQLIIGVDINNDDIIILKNEIKNNSIFITDKIDDGNIQSYIDRYNPTHLKCDIEGGEVAIINSDPKTIKNAAIEVHTPEIRKQFLDWFLRWGFSLYGDLSLRGHPHISVLFASRP